VTWVRVSTVFLTEGSKCLSVFALPEQLNSFHFSETLTEKCLSSIFYYSSFLILGLSYICNMRGFHWDNTTYLYSIPSSSLLLLYSHSPPPLPLSNNIWWVSLCCLHMYIGSALPSSPPLSNLSFPLLYFTIWVSIIFQKVFGWQLGRRLRLQRECWEFAGRLQQKLRNCCLN
jgi:hypothetical protein